MKKIFIISVIMMVISWILASCSTTTKPVPPVVNSRPSRVKYIYKVEAISKDGDTTFQKIIK